MTIIIAEAGINHNGSLSVAKEMANVAMECGADVIKYQTFWGITRLSEYELSKREWKSLKRHCDYIGIEFMSTPHTMDAIHFVDNLVDKHKIASPFLFYYNFLIEIAKKDKPILISTGNHMGENGMATIDEICNAIKFIKEYTSKQITLLHCVSKYPCENIHKERIKELSTLGYPVGLSDHTKNIKVMRHLPVIEKHFMLNGIECIDSNVSLNPEEFKRMVEYLRG